VDVLDEAFRRLVDVLSGIDPRVKCLVFRASLWLSLVGIGLVLTRSLPRRSVALQVLCAIGLTWVAMSVPVEMALTVADRRVLGFCFLFCGAALLFLPGRLSQLLVRRYFQQKLIEAGLYVLILVLVIGQILTARRG